jgi:hypothetical protein
MASSRWMTHWAMGAGIAVGIAAISAIAWSQAAPDKRVFQEPLGGGGGRDGYGGEPGDPWCRRCIIKESTSVGAQVSERPAICCSYGVIPEGSAGSESAEARSMCQYLDWFPSADSCLAACGEACTAHSSCGDDIDCDPNPCYSCTIASAPLQRPTRLSATLQTGGRVDLSWSDNSTAEAGHRVYRAMGTGGYAALMEESADTAYSSDMTVTESTWYRYKVTAFDGTQESPSSNEVRLYSGAPRTAPKLLAPAPSACVSVRPRFEWTPLEEATRYQVEVFEGAIPTADLAACTGNSTSGSYQPGGDVLKPGQLYTWRVKAMTGPLSGPYSSLRHVTAGCAPDQ